MTTLEVGKKLVALCQAMKFDEAMELYAADIVSIEAGAPAGPMRESSTVDAKFGSKSTTALLV